MDTEDKNTHKKMDAEDKNPCMCRLNIRLKKKKMKGNDKQGNMDKDGDDDEDSPCQSGQGWLEVDDGGDDDGQAE